MKKYRFILLILSFFLASCRQTDDIEIKIQAGQVISKETYQPLSGIKSYLIYDNLRVDSMLTDNNGRYSYSHLNYGKHRVDFAPGLLYTTSLYNDWEKENSLLILNPNAFLKISIKNDKPFDDNDKIWIFVPSPNPTVKLSGQSINKIQNFTVPYNDGYPTQLSYTVIKDNKTLLNEIPIKLTSFDTTTVTINY